MINKPKTLLVLIIVAALLGAAIYFIQVNYFDAEHGGAQIDYALNVSDDRELVGFSSDVFIGKVIERTGTSTDPLSTNAF